MRVTTVSVDGVRFVEGWEGVIPKWYQDIGGVWTGGVGHVERDPGIRALYPPPFSRPLIDSWLHSDLGKAERAICALLTEFGQHEMDALGSACFNLGTGLLAPANTITRRLLAGDLPGAGDALLEWCHYRDASGVVRANQGLLNRRRAERALLLTPDQPVLYQPDTTGYETCSAGFCLDPDELRAQGEALWLSDREDYGARDLTLE